MKTLSRLLLSVVLFVGFLADSSFGKAFGPRAASPAAFSATNAAWYSLAGAPSDSTYLLGTGVTLIADRSGNSGSNGLVLNGASGNYASFLSFGAFGTGDFSCSLKITVIALPATAALLFGGQPNALGFYIKPNGTFLSSLAAVGDNTASTGTVSAGSTYVLTYVRSGSTGTYYIDGVSAGTTTDNRNYSVGCTSLFADASTTNFVLTGIGWWAHAYNVALNASQVTADVTGAIQSGATFDVNFSLVAKLATSFTAITGGTVTINTSGDLGARICGARDLVQLTAAKQPAFSVVGGYNTATFDGSNDYMKAAAFPLSQPESVYFVGSQVTWTPNDTLTAGSVDALNIFQRNSVAQSPQLDIYAGSSAGINTSALAIATKGVIRAIFNGSSSALGINLGSSTVANAGSTASNGFTLGSAADGSAGANITFNEALLRSVADDATTQNALTAYEMLTWGITP